MTELLNCTGLSKAYGKKRALDHVDLHLEPGKIIGLLGPNGSGKTTLMKLANGLLQPTEGSITIAGSVPGPATKEIVSYLPDAAWLPDWMRVEQLVEMFHDFYADFDPARAGEMLAKLELDPKAPLKTLSKGNKDWRCGPGGAGLHPAHHSLQLQRGRHRGHLHAPDRGH